VDCAGDRVVEEGVGEDEGAEEVAIGGGVVWRSGEEGCVGSAVVGA